MIIGRDTIDQPTLSLLGKRYLVRMTHFTVIALIVCTESAAFSQSAPASSDSISSIGPNLEETISFMNKSVTSENSYVTSVNECELYFTRNNAYTLALPVGKYVKSTDGFGIPHYGFKWLVVQDAPRVIRFNLAKIDPTSIKSTPAPSTAFIKERDVDEHPEELNHPDLMMLMFSTANSEQSIEVGHFKDADVGKVSPPLFDKQSGAEILVFESRDRAERFVTAFVHAVKLCGGTGTEFPPTPSEP